MVSILGGFAKGLSLMVPNGTLIRPTSVLLKRRIFDSFQDLSGYTFVDLCAGSGAIGLEACSRGANRIYLVEPHRAVFSILSKNVGNFSSKYNAKNLFTIEPVAKFAEKWMVKFFDDYKRREDLNQQKTVLFLDPPYEEKKVYRSIISYLGSDSCFKGQLWIESDRQKGLSIEELEAQLKMYNLEIGKIFKQGTSFIAIVYF